MAMIAAQAPPVSTTTSGALARAPGVAALLGQHQAALIERWADLVRSLPGARFSQQPPEERRAWAAQALDALLQSLTASPAAFDAYLAGASGQRLESGLHIGEVNAGLLLGRRAAAPFILRAQASDPDAARASLQHLDAALLNLVYRWGSLISRAARARDESQAIVEERQRLARELHDSVAQSLYTIALYADAAGLALGAGKVDLVQGHLQALRATAQEGLRDIRLILFELRPRELEQGGLTAAIEARLEAVEARVGLRTRLDVEGEERLTLTAEEELYRIIQEALNNVIKHAHATQVAVRLRFAPDAVSLEVVDDGVGFDPRSARAHGGQGLDDLDARARKIGACLEVHSAPGDGTRLCLRAPLTLAPP